MSKEEAAKKALIEMGMSEDKANKLVKVYDPKSDLITKTQAVTEVLRSVDNHIRDLYVGLGSLLFTIFLPTFIGLRVEPITIFPGLLGLGWFGYQLSIVKKYKEYLLSNYKI